MFASINSDLEVRINCSTELWEDRMKSQGLFKADYRKVVEIFGKANSWLPEDALVAIDEWRILTPDGAAILIWYGWNDMAKWEATFKVLANSKNSYRWLLGTFSLRSGSRVQEVTSE